MISRSASRRIRRERTGGLVGFRRRQKLARVKTKIEHIDAMLASGVTVTRDPETKKFVGLRAMRERLGRFFRPNPQPVTA